MATSEQQPVTNGEFWKEQEEKRNGCRRKNTRNQHRGKRKAL